MQGLEVESLDLIVTMVTLLWGTNIPHVYMDSGTHQHQCVLVSVILICLYRLTINVRN